MGKKRICTRKCFVCQKPLVGSFGGKLKQEFREAPSHATVWTTRGNWGSTVLDMPPYEKGIKEISICDICYKEREHLILDTNDFAKPKGKPAKTLSEEEIAEALKSL